jgi:hypothetical protein
MTIGSLLTDMFRIAAFFGIIGVVGVPELEESGEQALEKNKIIINKNSTEDNRKNFKQLFIFRPMRPKRKNFLFRAARIPRPSGSELTPPITKL